MKKFWTTLFVFCGLLLCTPCTVFGLTEAVPSENEKPESISFSITVANPRYAEFEQDEPEFFEEDASVYAAEYQGSTYYEMSDLEEAGALLRQGLKERQDVIEIPFCIPDYSYEKVSEISSLLIDEAVRHTGNPLEGDTLAWQYQGYSMHVSGFSVKTVGYVNLIYDMDYRTTLEQEETLTREVDRVLRSLVLKGKTDEEKILAIYDYITDHVAYDHENLNDDNYQLKFTAYAAQIDGKAVCQGYALLLYRFALEAGVDCRLISGTSNGQNHGWNIVRLGDRYYNLDSTWDAGKTVTGYNYFLQSEANFRGHTRFEICDTEEFHALHPMSETDFDAVELLTAPRFAPWKSADENSHSRSTYADDEIVQTEPHADEDEDGRCDICDFHAHRGELIAEQPQTCTMGGMMAYYQCFCGDKFADMACTELILDVFLPPLGHEVVTDAFVAPTCTEDGLTEGSHCSRCNVILTEQMKVAALGHQETVDAAVAPTCTENGFTEGSHCSRCNAVLTSQKEVVALGHQETVDTAVAPTCTEEGLTEGIHCSRCNVILTEQGKVAALGHQETVDAAVEPTCVEDGLTEGAHCSRCNTVLKEQKPVAALGHSEVIDEAIEAACEISGLTEGRHCSRCNQVLTAQITIAPLGHTETADEKVEPTCTMTGLEAGSHCTVCGKVLEPQKTIAALGHSVVLDEAIDPTCITTGLTEGSHCSRCDEILTEQKVLALGEHEPDTDPSVGPTCSQAGLTEGSHCSVCGEILVPQQVVPSVEHKHMHGACVFCGQPDPSFGGLRFVVEKAYYTGKSLKPNVTVYDGETKLIYGADYTVSYKNNKKVADENSEKPPMAIVTCKGNYKGKYTVPFAILKSDEEPEKPVVIDLSKAEVTISLQSEKVPHTKNGAKPKVLQVTVNGKMLNQGTDFTVSYKNNKKVSSADEANAPTVVLKGKGNYKGTALQTFDITPCTDVVVTVNYKGAVKVCEVASGKTLTKKDFFAKDGIVTGLGNYDFSEKYDVPNRETVKAVLVNPKAIYAFSGSAVRPQASEFRVTRNGEVLTEDQYTLFSCVNNFNKGTAIAFLRLTDTGTVVTCKYKIGALNIWDRITLALVA